MNDTVALSRTLERLPDFDDLQDRGWIVLASSRNGPYRAYHNQESGLKTPRLTISTNPRKLWVLKAEVSIPTWHLGSTLSLPSQSDIDSFYPRMNDYVSSVSNLWFDAFNARVSKVHFTEDLSLDEAKVLSVIADLRQHRIPRFNCCPINDTTVNFTSKGRKRDKSFCVYSKFHQMEAEKTPLDMLETSKWVLRLESKFDTTKAVYNLAKSLRLPSHCANQILNTETHRSVMRDMRHRLFLESRLTDRTSPENTLAANLTTRAAMTCIAHLHLKRTFGSDYHKMSVFRISHRAARKYDKTCSALGILRLE
jgi:hypothetical protein